MWRTTLLSLLLFVSASGNALAQQQEYRYLVVWKSRYNDRNYRSQWFYGDPTVADSVADDLRQFHAFTDVKVITVPVTLSPDGISAKITKSSSVPDDFAGRGTGAFTVTDLWNYSVPGGTSGAGDPQVISLRRADSPSTPDSGVQNPANANANPVAPGARERLDGQLEERTEAIRSHRHHQGQRNHSVRMRRRSKKKCCARRAKRLSRNSRD